MENGRADMYPQWSDFIDALGRFCNFLEDVTSKEPLRDWHVIFNMGTTIRVNIPSGYVIPESDKFHGYDGCYLENWPQERLSTDNINQITLGDILREVTLVWENQSKIVKPEGVNDIISRSYKMLLEEGYPLPGHYSNRTAIPFEQPVDELKSATQVSQIADILWGVIWTERNPAIINLVIDDDAYRAVLVAGELRCHDFMFPKIRAIISPQLDCYIF